MSFKIIVSLLIFFSLDDLSNDVSGMLQSSTIIVLLSISPIKSINIYFINLGSPILDAYMLTRAISSS